MRILLLVLLSFTLHAQDISQLVTGHVKEALAGSPLTGANVSLFSNDQLIQGRVTDVAGYFEIRIAPGRYRMLISFTGYQAYEQEILVVAGKPEYIAASLTETPTQLDAVTVNFASVSEPGETSLTIEKTLRVPANFFDPVRMLVSYPGVITANDQANSIVVKGYSPNALLWRLQGLDIVNPNHLANAGTFSDKPVANGGGVNILSAQLLDKTSFYSGNLPARYGNALAGILDMSLRPGSTDKVHYTAQASLIGLDVAAEGPISKESKSSFLVNYRYSTVGLLSQLGVDFGDEAINFQDLSFNLNFPGKKGGSFNAFGFAGLSTNKFEAKPEAEWEEEKDRYNIDYDGKVYALGVVKDFKPGWLTPSVGVSVSGQIQDRNSDGAAVPYVAITSETYNSDRVLFSSFLKGAHKLNKGVIEAGVTVNYLYNKLFVETTSPLNVDDLYPNVRGTVEGTLIQPYITWNQLIGEFELNAGLRYVNFQYNNSDAWEPRVSIGRMFNAHRVTLSYGLTSQWQQVQTYLAPENESLPLTKSSQAALEWRYQIKTGLSIHSTVYYHSLFDVPVLPGVSQYSLINQWEDFPEGYLKGTGKGRNYGIEAMLDRKFYSDLYFMISGSYFQAEYNVDDEYWDSRFNGGFTSTLLAGKEWKREQRSFGIHGRVIYTGGLRQAPVDVLASSIIGTTYYDLQNGYSLQVPDYFRTDLRVSWRKNKPGYTRTISIDLQNVTGYKNVAGYYYDTHLQAVTTRNQLGILPVFAYRVDF